MKSGKLRNILLAVLTIVLGVVLFIWSKGSMNVICWIVGLGFIAAAVIMVITAIRSREDKLPMVIYLICGIVALIAGIIFLAKPDFVIALLPIFVGLGIAANGVLNLIDAIKLKKVGLPMTAQLILSIIAIVFGIIIFANPFSTMDALVKAMGVVLMYNEIANCISAFKN